MVLSSLLFSIALAQDDAIDAYIKAEMTKQRIPGIALAIVQDGKVMKSRGYGVANVEHQVPVTDQTIFRLASVSKHMIAAGILRLAEDGKLNLTDPISKYLEGSPAAWSPITLRHVLTHTSGIPRESPTFDENRTLPDAEVIRGAYSLPLNFEPGAKYEYCNVGYFILAEVVRKVTDAPWPDYYREKFFEPLGMTATGATSQSALIPNRASGYSTVLNRLRNAVEMVAVRPSGAFRSNLKDLIKWDAALFAGKVIPPSRLQEMLRPTPLNDGKVSNYGLGMGVGPALGREAASHSGGTNGIRTHYLRLIKEKLTVILLANCESADAGGLATQAAKLSLEPAQ